ncbi:phosphoenolpyruvate carboxykinase (ATP), partial [Enterococcus faecium]
VGVTCTSKGEKVLVTGDIRNGNGRTVKSRYATPDRVDYLSEKIDAVFWIMKDDSLPPIIKINDPVLAASFGATL